MELHEIKKDRKDLMREMREAWRAMGYIETLTRVHIADKEFLLAIGQLLTGKRVINTIEEGGDDALEMAFTLGSRRSLRGAITIHELVHWHEINKALFDDEIERRYDVTYEALMKHITYQRVADNAKAYLETQDRNAEKYEEAAINDGLASGWLYIANAYWRMLKEGRWYGE